MAVTTRAGKGSALSFAEMDANFTELEGKADQSIVDINTAEAAIAGLQSTISTAQAEIDALQAAVAALPGASGSATTGSAGIVELATNGETSTGTDATRAVTPAGLKHVIDGLDLGGGDSGGVGTGINGTGSANFVIYRDTTGTGTPSFTFPGDSSDIYMILYGFAQGGLTSHPGTVVDDSFLFTGTIKGGQTLIGDSADSFLITAVKLA